MDGKIIRLSVVDSTNIYTSKMLSQSDMEEWTTIVADHQTLGKGQRGRTWESQIGSNLLCSTVIFPRHLGPDQSFLMAMVSSMAVIRLLDHYKLEAQIKWPNDILVNGRKIAGLLVENQIVGSKIESSVVGLGLNVNQKEFSDYTWKATSLALQSQLEYDLDVILSQFRSFLKQEYQRSQSIPDMYFHHYTKHLFGRGKSLRFQQGQQLLEGVFSGVDSSGRLHLETPMGVKIFSSGEIRFMNTSS